MAKAATGLLAGPCATGWPLQHAGLTWLASLGISWDSTSKFTMWVPPSLLDGRWLRRDPLNQFQQRGVMRRMPREGGAAGNSSKKTIWFNSHFSNPGTYRKGEWGVQETTGRSELRGRVFQTAHAPPCLLCQVARSKGQKAPGTSCPQPTVLWKPAPLLGSHCLYMASRGQHRPTLQSDPEQTRLAGLTLQSGIQGHIRATSRALHTPG